MVNPITKKMLAGVPTVALSAMLACTMVGCGGGGATDAAQSGSSSAAASAQPAYQSQSVEIDGNTFESVADGTFYAGDKAKKDGFYLRLKITNNGDKPLKFTGFSVKAAQGELEAGDEIFRSSKAAVLEYTTNDIPEALYEGAKYGNDRPDILAGESVEFVYFWVPKAPYYGPITVNIDSQYKVGQNPAVMRFDTTATETEEYKDIAAEAGDSKAAESTTGVDCDTFKIEATEGFVLDSGSAKEQKARFYQEGTDSSFKVDVFPRSPEEEIASLQKIYEGKNIATDQVDIKGTTWLRLKAPDNTYTMFASAPNGKTVRVQIHRKLNWDDALPMLEGLTLK